MQRSTSRFTILASLLTIASLAFTQGTGCSSKEQATPPSDGGAESTSGEGGDTVCEGPPPVMKWADSTGALHDPDWSCYDVDAAFAAQDRPFIGDAGDDGGEGGDDASADAAVDVAAPPEAGPLPEASAPETGSAQDTFQLTDFTTHFTVPGAAVDLFYGNTLAGGAAPDLSGMTSSTDAGPAGYGAFLFPPPPGSVFAYRVQQRAANPALQQVIQFDNLPPKTGTTFAGNSITAGSYDILIAGVLGTPDVVPGTGLLVSGARDCASHEVLGAVLTLVDDATSQPLPTGKGATDLHETYFGSDNFPHTECTHTVSSPIALWGAINIPLTSPLRVQIWGRMRATDSAPVLIGERKLELYPAQVVIARAYRLTPLN